MKRKQIAREKEKTPPKKRIDFQKKRKISEAESSSEEEHGLDENALCDDSSDKSSDNEGGVQTALSLDSMEVDDHILVAFESDRTTLYFVGRVLEVTEEIRFTFMRKKGCDKFANALFYFPENPGTFLH